MAYGVTWSTANTPAPPDRVQRSDVTAQPISASCDSHMIVVVSIWVVGELEREDESILCRFLKAFPVPAKVKIDYYYSVDYSL